MASFLFSFIGQQCLENYIHPTALQRLVPGCVITYTDFDHAKNLCKNYPDSGIRGHLGGSKVAEHHYSNLTFDELRLTWYDGNNDEFINIYNSIIAKLN